MERSPPPPPYTHTPTHPGRGIVTELRGKELAMRLMMHPDAQVQSEALKCVQKVLLSRDKADYLSTQLAASSSTLGAAA